MAINNFSSTDKLIVKNVFEYERNRQTVNNYLKTIVKPAKITDIQIDFDHNLIVQLSEKLGFQTIINRARKENAPSNIVTKPRKNLFILDYHNKQRKDIKRKDYHTNDGKDYESDNYDDSRNESSNVGSCDSNEHSSEECSESDQSDTSSCHTAESNFDSSLKSFSKYKRKDVRIDNIAIIDLSNSSHRLTLIKETKPKGFYEIDNTKLIFRGEQKELNKLNQLQNLAKILKEPAKVTFNHSKVNNILQQLKKNVENNDIIIDENNNIIGWNKEDIYKFQQKIKNVIGKIESNIKSDDVHTNMNVKKYLEDLKRKYKHVFYELKDNEYLTIFGLKNDIEKINQDLRKFSEKKS